MVRKWMVLMCLAFWMLGVSGREAVPVVEDRTLEAKVQVLAEQLRCLVCQNQNLADSHADLAVDLKNQVRDMLAKGMSEQQVIDFMVQRYGDFVLYNPPVKNTTWLLWGGPFALLVSGLGFLFLKLKKRRSLVAKHLSPEDRLVARQLLDNDDKGVV
jgi:cytochrome c-type biogenesis protein CcmH